VKVAVLADDLIWSTRLTDALRAAGAEPVAVRSIAALATTDATRVIVDLTARAYDGVAAIEAAAARDLRVLAVGQHDDHELRKRALAAGAERVYAYRKLFEAGPATLKGWLEAGVAPPG
jgi:DNA-binding NarL/FixJ family response regulator